jgi:hypothetical protein
MREYMIGKKKLRVVSKILADLSKTNPRSLFTPDAIIISIENTTGQTLYDGTFDDVKEILLEHWGFGIEPVTIGGHVWQFGPGKRPVSQEIQPPE